MPALYDPFAVAAHEDPYRVYQILRDEHPVYHNVARGFWALSRFDDVQAAARDWQTFSNASGVSPGEYAHFFGLGDFLEMDPPDHTRLRGVLRRRFSAAGLQTFEAGVRRHAVELAGAMLDGREHDLASGFARPLPARAVADLLGLPSADCDFVFDLFLQTMHRPPGEERPSEAARNALHTLQAYLLNEVAARRSDPRDDLLSDIVIAERAGTVLPGEVAGICTLLVVAGLETTSNLIGSSLRLLAEHPDQRALLIDDPSLIPRAIEELLRFESPLQFHARVTTRRVRLHGRTIPAGQWVLLLLGAANRDDRQFIDAERLDVMRPPKRNVAFGDGIHHCIGAPLARLESRVALEVLLKRAPTYRLLGGAKRYESHFLRGVSSLRARLDG